MEGERGVAKRAHLALLRFVVAEGFLLSVHSLPWAPHTCTWFCNSCTRREQVASLKCGKHGPLLDGPRSAFLPHVRPAGGGPRGNVSDNRTSRPRRFSTVKGEVEDE